MMCPNKNTEEWKALERAVGKFEAYRLWANNGNQVPPLAIIEGSSSYKIYSKLKSVFPNVEVIENTAITSSGRVVKNASTGNPTIEINPELMRDDTLAHEFSHVYIDLMGGMDNSLIYALYNQLKDTDMAQDIRDRYSELDEVRLQKEIVATALGKKVSDISNEESKKNRIKKIIDRIFNFLSSTLGINRDYLSQVANNVLHNGVSQIDAVGTIDDVIQNQKIKEESEKTQPELSKINKIRAKAVASLTVKHNLLKERIKYAENPEEMEKAVDAILELKNIMDKKVELTAIGNYAKNALSQSKAAKKRLSRLNKELRDNKIEDDNKFSNSLSFINNYVESFNHVGQFIEAVNDKIEDEEYSEDEMEEAAEILKGLKDAQSEIENAKKTYIKIARRYSAMNMAKHDKRVLESFKVKAEREFNLTSTLKGEEKQIALQEYTNNYLKENEELIREETIKYYSDYIESMPSDASVLDLLFRNPRSINEVIAQNLVSIFDKQDFSTRQSILSANRDSKRVLDKYKEYVGNTQNMKDLYEPLIDKKTIRDKDGNPTGDFQYLLPKPGSKKYKEIKEGKYSGTPVEDMYDYLLKTKEKTDKLLPKRYRLGYQYMSIDKDTKERLFDNGVLAGTKESIAEMFRETKSDVETGSRKTIKTGEGSKEVLTDATDKEFKQIPVHYRGKIDEKDASFDLVTNTIIDLAQATNYRNKMDVMHSVSILRDTLASTNVKKRRGFNRDVLKSFGSKQELTEDGELFNALKIVDNIIDQRMYGIRTRSSEVESKWAGQLKSYTSLVTLGMNVMSAGANFLQGRTLVLVEGVKGQEYTVENIKNSAIKVTKDVGGITGDIGATVISSKTNLLLEMFDGLSDWSGNKIAKFSNENRARKLLSTEILSAPNQAAEYHVQARLMYALLDNIKVTDKNGKFLNKNLEVVENKEDAASIDEVLEVVDVNGVKELKFPEQVAGTDRTGLSSSADMVHQISRILGKKNRNLFGNYRKENKTLLGMYALGSLAEHMRKWMGESLLYLFGGHKTLFKMVNNKEGKRRLQLVKAEDISLFDKRFSEETGKFDEGIATTSIRFISTLLTNTIQGKKDLASWKTMTKDEKRNVMAMAVYTAVAALGLVISKIAAGDDDDEDNVMLSFYARRLYSELIYFHPLEMMRITKTPAVSMSMLVKTNDLILQAFGGPLETFERGKHKGENKLKVKFMKVTPLNSFLRDFENSLNYLENGVYY